MTKQQQISLPPRLVQLWVADYARIRPHMPEQLYIAKRAFQFGASNQLDAIYDWIHDNFRFQTTPPDMLINQISAAFSPKMQNAIEIAQDLIERNENGSWVPSLYEWGIIRHALAEANRALEALPDE
jgi:hypothetical protein